MRAPLALLMFTLGVLAVECALRRIYDRLCPSKLYAHLRSGPKISGLASRAVKSTK